MNKLAIPVTATDNQTGGSHARITLVEYGDYQCPYCGMAHPIIKRLLKERGDDIRFVFRNFPLQTIHSHAMAAAFAAEAASKQNQFWKMHDLLFNNQHQLGEELFSELADKLKLDVSQFQRDFSSKSIQSKVDADFKSGMHSGVNGTPSFFINDTKINLPELTYGALLDAVDKVMTNSYSR